MTWDPAFRAEIAEFYSATHDPVVQWLGNKFPHIDTESAVHDAYEATIAKWHTITGDRTAYLFTAAKHRALDHVRRRKADVPLDAVGDRAQTSRSDPPAAVEARDVTDAFRFLTEGEREVMDLVAFDWTNAEIAGALDKTMEAVRAARRRAAAKLTKLGHGEPSRPRRRTPPTAPPSTPDTPGESDNSGLGSAIGARDV